MNIFGRPLANYTKNLRRLPYYVGYSLKCLRLFKHPWSVLYHYFTLKPLREPLVELRGGLKIHLSGDRYDIVTVFLIFVREDYGRIQPGSSVVDIGANVGVFSLYSAYRRARRVYAYEPNSQSYACLLRNIADNHLEDVIVPRQFAVTGTEDEAVKFPIQSSAFNAIITGETTQAFEWVKTTTLARILREHALKQIDLLKMDCEGAEYAIVFQSPYEVWSCISDVRLEYHQAQIESLTAFLADRGFKLIALRQDSPHWGNVWFKRS
jgi:FkbM family methyltransferase